jgi:phosphotriesterase-related protein
MVARFFIFAFLIFVSCRPGKEFGYTESVRGTLLLTDFGTTLIHEHVLVDFIGADSTGYHRWEREEVIAAVLPYLKEIRDRGVETVMECTPAYLGRDPILLQQLSQLSGLQFVTNTGYYGAREGKFLPPHAFEESALQLAERWISEFENGIEDTGIKPGFIKISVNESAELSEMDRKLVEAAAITQKATGLLIMSHTGKWDAVPSQVEVLKEAGADISRFVWVHAQAEPDYKNYLKAAEMGIWISLDGIAWEVESHLEQLIYARENGILEKVLISHDAGWYSPGEPGGGDFKGYTALFDELIPLLLQSGFTKAHINMLLVKNPQLAFSISK